MLECFLIATEEWTDLRMQPYQPVRKCHLGSSFMRASAVRSVSRQEVTNDMVQIN